MTKRRRNEVQKKNKLDADEKSPERRRQGSKQTSKEERLKLSDRKPVRYARGRVQLCPILVSRRLGGTYASLS